MSSLTLLKGGQYLVTARKPNELPQFWHYDRELETICLPCIAFYKYISFLLSMSSSMLISLIKSLF